MAEYEEDELIEEIRRKDEQIRELEAELAAIRPGDTETLKLQDLLIDPSKKLEEYAIRVEPRVVPNVGTDGVYIKLTKRSTNVATSAACDLQTAERIAYTILNIVRDQQERRQRELEARPIDDLF